MQIVKISLRRPHGILQGSRSGVSPVPLASRCPALRRAALVCPQVELEQFDGVSAGKYTIGLGQEAMAFCCDQEDVISMR